MTAMPANYYQRHDPTKEYEEHLFRSGRGLQSAELNEIQKTAAYRLRGIADVIFRDGSIVRDAGIVVDPDTGVTQCASGAVYVRGAVRGLAPATFTIPVVGTVAVGVRLIESVVTALTDPSLRDPATATMNFDEEGAERLRVHSQWGWDGDGIDGEFFPIYEVVNGVVGAKEPPPNLDAVTQALARYDRDSAGGTYVVSGMVVSKLPDAAGGQAYSIAEGRARVFGYGIELPTARRVIYPATPDLLPIANEPHQSTTAAAQRVTLDRSPATDITEVSITAERTVTLTHGVYTGAQDPLPDTSVLQLMEIKQGGTTYTLTADYLLTAGRVDWSPGGAEPAPGSTYSVKYRYITNAVPTAVDLKGFTVTGAVAGTLILVTYKQMVPRIDRLCLSMEGHPVWIQGVASPYNQRSPSVPSDMLSLASVLQTWDDARVLSNDGVRVVPMPVLSGIDNRFNYLLWMIAQQRLESNIHTREGGTKKGIFVDPFLDDSQRDAGTPQTAAIVKGELLLPISASVSPVGSDITEPATCAHTPVMALFQPLRTGAMKINPYMSFSRPPARVKLIPDVDRWTEVVTDWTSDVTERFDAPGSHKTDSAWAESVTTDVSVNVLSSSSTLIENLRQITVNYQVSGFSANEALGALTFDGVSLPTGGVSANSAGAFSGSFAIPEGIPAGNKNVTFTGVNGSYGETNFFGQGTLESNVSERKTTVTTFWRDPLAQTFTLPQSIQVSDIDVWVAIATTTDLTIQIRETTAGFPNRSIVAQATVSPDSLTLGGAHTRLSFPSPVFLMGGVEYGIVALCNDSIGELHIAELGKYDSNAGKWVTSQPYVIGVLLSSSNASTWTAHQDRDMTFRVMAAHYTETSHTVPLGNVAVAGVTDLILKAYAELPSSATQVEYQLTLPGGEVVTVADGQPVALAAAVTGNINIAAKLYGSADFSPVLYPGTQLITGILSETGTYISRAVPAGPAVSVKIIYEALIPSGATVAASYKGPDLADTWVSVPTDATRNVDGGFIEFTHILAGVDELSVQIKLLLSGTAAARPRVRDLRVIVL